MKDYIEKPINRRTFLSGSAKLATATAIGLTAPSILPSRARAATKKIRFGIIPAYSFGLYWVAQEQGWLKEQGIELEMSIFPSGPPAIEAMVGGSIDVITVGSVPPLAAAYRKVADFREISICGDASGLFTIVCAPDVTSLKELEGRKIAITSGSNFDYFLDTVLKAEGLEDMPLTRVNMEPIDGQAAFVAGAVDATVPLATSRQLIFGARPDANLVVDGSKLPLDVRPSIMDVLMTTQPYLDANKEALTKLVRTFHGPTINMLRTENAKVVDEMVRWQTSIGKAAIERKDVEPLLNNYFYFNTQEIKEVFANKILEKSLTAQAQFLVSNKRIGGMPDIDALVSDEIIKLI